MLKRTVVFAVLAMLGQLSNAASISNSASGLASPATTITFDEVVLPALSSVTNQYSGLGVTFSPNLYYSGQSGFPNISGNTVTNFGSGPHVFQFSLKFLVDQTDVAFAMVSNGTSWLFEALLDNSVVESFNASVDTSANDFFGFTSITFDEIRVTTVDDFMIIDNLQLGTTNNVPEPTTLALLGLGLAGLGILRKKAKA